MIAFFIMFVIVSPLRESFMEIRPDKKLFTKQLYVLLTISFLVLIVGSGIDKISLYRGKNIVSNNIPSAKAVDSLINLIKDDGNWTDPDYKSSLTAKHNH